MASARYDLSGRTVAILSTHGFEESELLQPMEALREADATVKVISLSSSSDQIRGWADGDWGESVKVDAVVSDVSAGDFDALVLPGGVINPDKLRMDSDAVDFVRAFFEAGKPVAAICHGPWLLAEADVARGRDLTSWASIRTDMENAGANWVDEEVVVDQGLVTSRSPDDLDAFVDKMLEEIFEGIHSGQHT
ncbi:MAG: type 1 glutamine amidotransferase [Gemmatimonadales bacterium]|nr:MAG: type 1 glutamine amidotransferase [Gemmatimonadales bacterium]